MGKELINLSNLQRFLSKLNEKFALKKAMKGISEDVEGNITIGEEGLVPTPDENSKGKFLRSDGEWALPSETAVYDSMTLEEGVAGVSKVDRVINAKNLKQIVNSDGFLTSLDSSKLTGVINIENLPQGALERILIVSSKEERLTLLDTEVQLGDVVKESDTGLMYYVINTEKLNSEEGYTQFTAGSASSVPWSGVTDKPTIPTKTSDLTNDSDFAIDSGVVHKTGDETINGTKTFTQTVNIKNNNFDLNVTPTNNIFSTIAFRDKNNTTTASLQNSQRTYGVNDICFYVYDADSNPHGFRIRTDKKLEPIENNTYSLGSAGNKWEKIYSDDVVHTSGNETIAGNKTFSNQMYLGGGGTSHGLISAKDNNSILRLFGGTSADTGANLDLYGEGLSSGGFSLRARTSDKLVGLDGKTDGTLKWNGKDVALDENLVHKTGDETITGTKTFTNNVYSYNLKHPTDNSYFYVSGGSDWNKGANLFLYGSSLTGSNAGSFGLVARNTTQTKTLTGYPNGALTWDGKNVALDENLVHRSGNETINGAKTFSSKIVGNLQGNADTATSSIKATQDSAGQQINKTYIKELSVSGRTITYKRGDNTTGTITTQDTNTTYSKLSQFTNDTGFITSSGSCNYATTAGSAGNGVDSCGEGLIRFKNGIQMCWGSGNNSDTSTSIVVNFTRTFSSTPVIFSQCYNSALYNCWVSDKNSNRFTLNFDVASTVAYDWFAIGTWK